jgi:MarR-like DNA-binding transcriptional regulator SgrR of sgrS sRNA
VTSSGFDPGLNDPIYGNGSDLDAAKELLRSSAYAGEVLQLYTYEYFSNEEDVRWIRQECGKLGVKVEINVLPIQELSQARVIVQADMIFAGEVLGGQPSIALIEMYRSPNGYIRNHLDAATLAKVDGRIQEALGTADPEQRMQILRGIEAELKKQCSVLFMYHSVQSVGHEKALHGIEMNAWGKINYKEIWMK